MANDLKTEFIQLCKTLQGPHLVAKFQQFCGVRGTFPRKSSETSERELERFHNGACTNYCPDDGENGTEDGCNSDGPRQRKTTTEGSSPTHDDCINGLLNGTAAQISGAGETEGQNVNDYLASARDGGYAQERCTVDSPDHGRGMLCDPCKEGESLGGSAPSIVKPLRKNSLTDDGGQEFIIENKFLFYLFTFGTELGNEMFFIVFFPFLIWNVDAYVSRQLIVVWVWVLFLGQSTKDLIRWTRPASPPVVKVEVFYNSEYSMPSTHAMSGTAIPFSLFLLTYGRWQYPFVFGLGLALSWSILVCVSRVYMGMHSVLEVIAGFLYSALILAVIQPALEHIDSFYLTSRHAPLVIVVLHVSLGLLAFRLDSWSTSRGDTAQALGTGAGAALASHLNHLLGLAPDPPLSQLPFAPQPLSAALVGRSLQRLALGVAVLLATRAAMKALTIPLVCRAVGVASEDVRRARQHMEVELPYRYIVYGTVGFSCVFLVPLLFSYLDLS
ncbi:sphingosine-1-phosphate phosphatase 1 [Anguilla anguilla]|uniref:sphingosine-1-phosphate phosphatase 1 n=1 Tax=Anguilla anguilla TaxID=7936 RepID=UPI0015ACBED6|nr:sphingosine-1-phosphate phosphatase 1 [Anguilla anguilla]